MKYIDNIEAFVTERDIPLDEVDLNIISRELFGSDLVRSLPMGYAEQWYSNRALRSERDLVYATIGNHHNSHNAYTTCNAQNSGIAALNEIYYNVLSGWMTVDIIHDLFDQYGLPTLTTVFNPRDEMNGSESNLFPIRPWMPTIVLDFEHHRQAAIDIGSEVNEIPADFEQVGVSSIYLSNHPNRKGQVVVVKLPDATSSTMCELFWREAMAALMLQRQEMQDEISPEMIELVADYEGVIAEYKRMNTELAEMKTAIQARETEIQSALSTYSATLRLNADEKLRMRRLPAAINKMSFDFARMGEGVKGMLASDRRIVPDSWAVTTDSIEFTTYPFVMLFTMGNWCNGCDEHRDECGCDSLDEMHYEIPSLSYRIDIRNGFHRQYFKVWNPDMSMYDNCHPHVQEGEPCLGSSELGLAEAWARRDWESVVTILLAWHAIYNDESPYIHVDQADDHFGLASGPARWLVPIAIPTEATTQEAVTA